MSAVIDIEISSSGKPTIAVSRLRMKVLTASSPLATLVLSFISSSLSALILAPIDTARTFLWQADNCRQQTADESVQSRQEK
jgi:hypothetical protein